MAYISEVAIEIRAPSTQAKKLEEFRAGFTAGKRTARAFYPNLERTILDEAEIVINESDDSARLRFFSAYMKGGGDITTALDTIEGGVEEHGWSGTWRRLGEDDGDMDFSHWGDDEHRYDAIFWRRGLEPAWTSSPAVFDDNRVRKIVGTTTTSMDWSTVFEAALPEIEAAIRKAARKNCSS